MKAAVKFAPPLPEHFRSKRTTVVGGASGGHWAVRCRRCKAAWAVPVATSGKPGVLLHLLNHARSHDAKAVQP